MRATPAASVSQPRRIEAARSLLAEVGWDQGRIEGPLRVGDFSILKVAPAGEPRLSVVLGRDEAAARPASLAYSSESEFMVHWGGSRISLGQPARWNLRPGDAPGIAGDASDRWALEDIFALAGPKKLLGGEAQLVSMTGKAHDSLAVQLGNTLASLRRGVAEIGIDATDDLDRALLRFFHQLLFIRVLEDRGAAHGTNIGAIYSDLEGDLVGGLEDLLAGYRATLNSELFQPSGLPLERVGAQALRPLLKSLVVPWQELELDFSLSRADLAGRLYQQYLKKTPALERAGEGRRPRLLPVAVQRDEQERTAAFYTPTSVASLLAADTLGLWLRDRVPGKAEDVRLIDPACGSGSFLVAGFHLIRAQLELSGRTLRRAGREAILRESIFGADVDAKAIEITQVQLLEAAELSGARLPDLDQNLFIGDSLYPPSTLAPATADPAPGRQGNGPELTDAAPPTAVPWDRILDRVGGFDAVLMNPPFGAQLRLPDRLEGDQRAALRERFPQVSGWGSDLAFYFVSLAFSLKKEDGCAGMIVPRKMLEGKGARPTREYVKSLAAPDRIVDFRGLSLFPGALPYVAFLEFLPGRRRVEALDVADSTVDPALALNTIFEGRNRIIRRTTAPRSALSGAWTPFALRWRERLSKQVGRDCRPLAEVDEIAVHQGTQSGAQAAFTIAEPRWQQLENGRLEVGEQQLDSRYSPLVAWGQDIVPLLAPVRRERLFLPFEDDKQVTNDPDAQALLRRLGGFRGRAQPGAIAALRAPKVILRGFSREPAAFADLRGDWITVKGVKGGLVLVPQQCDPDVLHGMAGLLCSSFFQWLLRGLGQPRRDETIEILQMHAEELPWPTFEKEDWRLLSKRVHAVIETTAAESGPLRTLAYRAAREDLDALVLELLEVGPKLRATIAAELVRYL